jgi:hypothetical protein
MELARGISTKLEFFGETLRLYWGMHAISVYLFGFRDMQYMGIYSIIYLAALNGSIRASRGRMWTGYKAKAFDSTAVSCLTVVILLILKLRRICRGF